MLESVTVVLFILGWSAYDTSGFRLGGHFLLAASVVVGGLAFWDQPMRILRDTLVLIVVIAGFVAFTHSPVKGVYILWLGFQPFLVRWSLGRRR